MAGSHGLIAGGPRFAFRILSPRSDQDEARTQRDRRSRERLDLSGTSLTLSYGWMISLCGAEMGQVLACMLLIGSILVCPFLCGAAEAGHAAHHLAGAAGPGEHSAPDDCPQEGDNCICGGAVQSADVRLPDLDAINSLLPLHGLTGILAHAPSHPLAHLTCEGTPTGLAGWGDSITVRALLQDFRC